MRRSHPTEHEFTSFFSNFYCLERISSALTPRGLDWKELSDSNLLSLLSSHILDDTFVDTERWEMLKATESPRPASINFFPTSCKDIVNFLLSSYSDRIIVRSLPGSYFYNPNLKNLADIYQDLKPNWLEEIFRDLEQESYIKDLFVAAKTDQHRNHLVQSRPGRFQVLSFSKEEQISRYASTLKQSLTLLKIHDYSFNQCQNAVGFFNGLALFSKDISHKSRYLGFFFTRKNDLEFGEKLADHLSKYAQENIHRQSNWKIYVCLPFLNLTYLLTKQFKNHSLWHEKNIEFFFPDLIFGTNSVLSFLDFLAQKQKNSIFIDLTSYPWAHIVIT